MYIKTLLFLLHLCNTSTLLAIHLQLNGKKNQVSTDNSKFINNTKYLCFLRDDLTENISSFLLVPSSNKSIIHYFGSAVQP